MRQLLEDTDSRVYVVVTGAGGAVIACRYLDGCEVPSWLVMKGGSDSVRCEVYDDAPVRGGKLLTAFVPHGRTWEEQGI